MAKKKEVILKEKRGGTKHSFGFDHALALLRLQEKTGNKGWEIDDKNWKFEDNEICRRTRSNRTGSKSEEQD